MYFLEPIWLWLSSLVLLPVVIHLWNTRKGKVLKVGSVALFENSSRRRSAALKITQWPLLLLRCAVILAAAILLARPVMRAGNSGKGWVLVDNKFTYNNYRTQVDSLISNGNTLHRFGGQLEGVSTDGLPDSTNAADSYWSLLAQADRMLPAGAPVYIFSSGSLTHFSGDRPVVSVHVKWSTAPGKDTSFLSDAWQASAGNVFANIITTTATRNSSKRYALDRSRPRQGDFTLDVRNGSVTVQYKGGEEMRVDTTALRVSVFTGAHPADARYVSAAIDAVRQVTQRNIFVRTFNTARDYLPGHWVFWLSEQAPPSFPGTPHILLYHPGQPVKSMSRIHRGPVEGADDPGLYKRVKSGGEREEALWTDDQGDPVLAKSGNNYRLYTRIDPSWTGLPWHASFPAWLSDLLKPDAKNITPDMRQIDPGELQFTPAGRTAKIEGPLRGSDEPMRKIFWLIVLLLFVAERAVSNLRKTDKA